MRHFGKKVTYNGIKFDSQKECDFYRRYLEHCGKRVEVHQRFKLFALKNNLPVEIVVPRAHDFKMTMFGWTKNAMLDQHVHYDIHGKMKINKHNGQPIYDHYNVYKGINYDIHDLVGW